MRAGPYLLDGQLADTRYVFRAILLADNETVRFLEGWKFAGDFTVPGSRRGVHERAQRRASLSSSRQPGRGSLVRVGRAVGPRAGGRVPALGRPPHARPQVEGQVEA